MLSERSYAFVQGALFVGLFVFLALAWLQQARALLHLRRHWPEDWEALGQPGPISSGGANRAVARLIWKDSQRHQDPSVRRLARWSRGAAMIFIALFILALYSVFAKDRLTSWTKPERQREVEYAFSWYTVAALGAYLALMAGLLHWLRVRLPDEYERLGRPGFLNNGLRSVGKLLVFLLGFRYLRYGVSFSLYCLATKAALATTLYLMVAQPVYYNLYTVPPEPVAPANPAGTADVTRRFAPGVAADPQSRWAAV